MGHGRYRLLAYVALRLLSEKDGNLELGQVLLERGADPNARSVYGWYGCYMALWKGRQGLVPLLLKYSSGADPNTRDVNDQTTCVLPRRPHRGYWNST
jgi:ankyrin repeat protein